LSSIQVSGVWLQRVDSADQSSDHPPLLAVPETHYLKCAVLQAV
jgi:23S rRNA G2069 N7-methylase RlmK/C1962 C5-methylase RlmI